MKDARTRADAARAKTRPWDAADHLKDVDDVVAYLEAAFEDGDPRIIAAALGDVARSRGMAAVAAKAGLGRESLYKALSGDGNPGFATVVGVMNALGLRLRPLEAGRDPGMPPDNDGAGWSGGFALPLPDLYVLSGNAAARPAMRASEHR